MPSERKATEPKILEHYKELLKPVETPTPPGQGNDANKAKDQQTAPAGNLPQGQRAAESADPGAVLDAITDVAEEKARFLYYPYIVRGKINIFAGDPDAGKTSFAVAVAAKVTKGENILSSRCEIEPSNILIISTEDDKGFLAGKFRESGGDKSKCMILNAEQTNSIESFDSPLIERYIKQNNIRLVIFDPLQRFIGSKTDMNRSNQTHPILSRLAAMANRHDCAVLIISHMSKNLDGVKLIHRILGSIDLLGASRSTLAAIKDPDDETRTILLHIKSNCAPKGKSMVYHMDGEFGGVSFDGYSALTARDIERNYSKRVGVKPEEDPVFIAIEKLFAENPGGLFITYRQLETYTIRMYGSSPYPVGTNWRSKIKTMERDLMTRAKIMAVHGKRKTVIHIEFGETITADGYQGWGVTLSRYSVTPGMMPANTDEE